MKFTPPVVDSIAFGDQWSQRNILRSDGHDSCLVVEASPYVPIGELAELGGGPDELIDQDGVVRNRHAVYVFVEVFKSVPHGSIVQWGVVLRFENRSQGGSTYSHLIAGRGRQSRTLLRPEDLREICRVCEDTRDGLPHDGVIRALESSV